MANEDGQLPVYENINEQSVLDHGYVKYVESWGSDERIIEAARMSTAKGFQGWDRDFRLLRYLWEHKHHTPFEMAGLTIEVQAPIFVFREWHRHRTQSYNELSARYTELPDLFYIPSIERLMNGGQSKSNKQASGTSVSRDRAEAWRAAMEDATRASRGRYDWLLGDGCARELSRIIVPLNQYSRMRASANLRNWLAFLTLRLDSGAQFETREFTVAVAKIVNRYFPRTFELFEEGRLLNGNN